MGLDPGGATAAGLLVVAGCTLDKPENQPKQVFNRIGAGATAARSSSPGNAWSAC